MADSTITIKLKHADDNGVTTTRKCVFGSTPPLAHLVDTASTRFLLARPLDFLYTDEDGDLITLSTDEELAELVDTARSTHQTLRFQVKTAASTTAAPMQLDPVQSASVFPSVKEVDFEWTKVSASPRLDEPAQSLRSSNLAASPEPATAVENEVLFEDPDDTPLASPPRASAEPILPDANGQSSPATEASQSSSTREHPGAFPEDPTDIPLPSSTPLPDHLPFSTLPTSLSSFLTSLGSRSTTFSSNLATAFSPTSPYSPTSRLSSILSTSTLDDLPLVASSLVQIGTEFAEIAKEVAQGVRREADEIRDEFGRLRNEVERERERFRTEVRGAMDAAAQGWNASESSSISRHEQGPDARPSKFESVHASSTAPPRYTPSESSTSTTTATESIRSTRSPSVSSSRATPVASTSATPLAPVDSSSSMRYARDTARALHKEAKQARKEYRAAVRDARKEKRREEKRATSRNDAVAVDSATRGEPAELRIPGGMPSTSTLTTGSVHEKGHTID